MPCPHQSALEHKLGQYKPKCERISHRTLDRILDYHIITQIFSIYTEASFYPFSPSAIKMLVKYTAAMHPCHNQSLIRNMAQENHFLRCTNKE